VRGRSADDPQNDRKDTEMGKVIATEWMTLDGVVQSPSYRMRTRAEALTAAAGIPATSMKSQCAG
jgi:hypothetical protein